MDQKSISMGEKIVRHYLKLSDTELIARPCDDKYTEKFVLKPTAHPRITSCDPVVRVNIESQTVTIQE